MRKFRGFLLKQRVTTIFRCVFRRNRSPSGYFRLGQTEISRTKPISRLIRWGRRLKNTAKSICSKTPGHGSGHGRGYIHVGQDPGREKAVAVGVPKGQMAVYVGQNDGDYQRVLVPVIYFNHPLFGKLLREAEEEYGFNHPGGITIPCRISEFESVQTRIKAGSNGRKMLSWKRPV